MSSNGKFGFDANTPIDVPPEAQIYGPTQSSTEVSASFGSQSGAQEFRKRKAATYVPFSPASLGRSASAVVNSFNNIPLKVRVLRKTAAADLGSMRRERPMRLLKMIAVGAFVSGVVARMMWRND